MKNMTAKNEHAIEDMKSGSERSCEGSCEIASSVEFNDEQFEDALNISIFSRKSLFILSVMVIIGMVILYLIINH